MLRSALVWFGRSKATVAVLSRWPQIYHPGHCHRTKLRNAITQLQCNQKTGFTYKPILFRSSFRGRTWPDIALCLPRRTSNIYRHSQRLRKQILLFQKHTFTHTAVSILFDKHFSPLHTHLSLPRSPMRSPQLAWALPKECK